MMAALHVLRSAVLGHGDRDPDSARPLLPLTRRCYIFCVFHRI
jgi:hypothetical protein